MLSGEVFQVVLILMSHLSHTTATAVAEDNGKECVYTKCTYTMYMYMYVGIGTLYIQYNVTTMSIPYYTCTCSVCTLCNEWLVSLSLSLSIYTSLPSLSLSPSHPSPSSQLSPESLIALLYSAPLQSILRKLLDMLQHTPGAMQQARAHLYGCLLYFLMVARQHPLESKQQRGQFTCVVIV